MRVISDLWNGNIAPCEHCGAQDSQANTLYTKCMQEREAIKKVISRDYDGLLENYGQCWEDYLLRMMELSFREGIILGAQLGMEVFHEMG